MTISDIILIFLLGLAYYILFDGVKWMWRKFNKNKKTKRTGRVNGIKKHR